MLLVPFYGTLFLSLGSCSIIIGPEPFPEIIERSSPSFNNVNLGEYIMNHLTQDLQEHHNHLLGKLDFLRAACKPSNTFPGGAFTYNVSADAFRDPRLNILVKVMSRKLQAVAEITMDDLEQKLKLFRLLVTQRILDKFTPLLSDIADLQNKMKNLANKRQFTQIGSDAASVILSRSGELSTNLSFFQTRNDFMSISSRLMELCEDIQRKIETLKMCENSPVEDSALEMSNKHNGNLAKIKESLRILSHTMNDTASNHAKELLREMLAMAKMNGLVLTALSSLVIELDNAYIRRLDGLKNDMKEIEFHINEFSFSSVIEEENEEEHKTAAEHEHQLTGDVKAMTNPLPCLDSKFLGHGRSLDICGAAVRLRKCFLQIVAFHCCRSCMDAGLISAAPDMRASRNLSALKALTFLRPT